MFYGIFGSADDIAYEFGIPRDQLDNINIVVAWYDYEDYDGEAFVLFKNGSEFYEVHGGHCSCMGLEDQWEPELSSTEALQRATEHNYGWWTRLPEEGRQLVLAVLNQ